MDTSCDASVPTGLVYSRRGRGAQSGADPAGRFWEESCPGLCRRTRVVLPGALFPPRREDGCVCRLKGSFCLQRLQDTHFFPFILKYTFILHLCTQRSFSVTACRWARASPLRGAACISLTRDPLPSMPRVLALPLAPAHGLPWTSAWVLLQVRDQAPDGENATPENHRFGVGTRPVRFLCVLTVGVCLETRPSHPGSVCFRRGFRGALCSQPRGSQRRARPAWGGVLGRRAPFPGHLALGGVGTRTCGVCFQTNLFCEIW